jgi:predicted metalloprotease
MFNQNAPLDTSQVSDARRMGGRGGAVAIGGGGLGLAGLLLVIALNLLGSGNIDLGPVLGGLDGSTIGSPAQADNTELEQNCRTGADANARQDCRVVAVVNSVQTFWTQALSGRYQPAQTTFFKDGVSSGCGNASTAMGPFYCPNDQRVYIDLGFYQELQDKFGARGGPFAEAYVIAHEYGHHAQHLLGIDEQVRSRQGQSSDSVRLELQADCFAGLWAHYATTTPDPRTGQILVTRLTQDDVATGLDAAAKIGDDYIQKKFQGSVHPEGYTHGTSAQRQKWLTTGLNAQRIEQCDTFAAKDL